MAFIKTFFDTFGAVVIVPIMLFFINIGFHVKPKKAFISALSAGVGLQGFQLIINAYGPIVNPLINKMVEESGVNLPITDMGWQPASIIAYSTEIGMIFVLICILIQLALFMTRYTTVFQAGDLWTNYSYMVWGSMLYLMTGSLFMGLLRMVVLQLYTLLCAEFIAPRWSSYYGYPSCSIASLHTVTCAPYAVAMNYLLDKLGLYKVKADPDSFKKKLGFMGDPMTLGLILGLIIGIIGNFKSLFTLKAWGEILACGIATAAVMAVFPKVSSIFSGSFTAITEATKKTAKGTKGEWFLAVNDATGYGEPATLITGIMLMPITLALAFLLPGNQTLPMLDLVAIPYIIQPIVASSKGNVVKSLISGSIWMAIGLYVCTISSPMFTQVAQGVGVEIATGIMMITSFAIFSHPLPCIIFLAFASQNILLIALTIVVYAVLFFLFKRNKAAIYRWIETSASRGEEIAA